MDNFDLGYPVDNLYVDFQKGFRIGCRIEINIINSDWQRVLSGVPQGSILCPLLFVICINDVDVDDGINSELLKFADECRYKNVWYGAHEKMSQ